MECRALMYLYINICIIYGVLLYHRFAVQVQCRIKSRQVYAQLQIQVHRFIAFEFESLELRDKTT